MRCQARTKEGETCGRPFAPDQEVIVVKDEDGHGVRCCSEACAKRTEATFKQGDMFGNRELMRYVVDETQNAHCEVDGISISESKDGLKIVLKIRLPEAASVDRLKDFMGQKATVSIAQERLDPIRQEKPKDEIEQPEPMSLEWSLFLALRHMEGADDRWQERREAGLTDNELKAAISQEFGVEGAMREDDMKPCAFEAGGGKPKFWFDDAPTSGKPTLEGKALVTKVRNILKIPPPQHKKKGKAA